MPRLLSHPPALLDLLVLAPPRIATRQDGCGGGVSRASVLSSSTRGSKLMTSSRPSQLHSSLTSLNHLDLRLVNSDVRNASSVHRFSFFLTHCPLRHMCRNFPFSVSWTREGRWSAKENPVFRAFDSSPPLTPESPTVIVGVRSRNIRGQEVRKRSSAPERDTLPRRSVPGRARLARPAPEAIRGEQVCPGQAVAGSRVESAATPSAHRIR